MPCLLQRHCLQPCELEHLGANLQWVIPASTKTLLFLPPEYLLHIFENNIKRQASQLVLIVNLQKPQLRNYQGQTGLWLCLWETVLIVNGCKRGQPTAGSTIPRRMALGYIRKLSRAQPCEWASIQRFSVFPASSPCLAPILTSAMGCALEIESTPTLSSLSGFLFIVFVTVTCSQSDIIAYPKIAS